MSLFITSINSGSNGNCYYVGNESEAVLVDVGISCKEIEERMNRLQLPIEKVKAIFISHEHVDHIRGVARLSKKYYLPVYIKPRTYKHSGIHLDRAFVHNFNCNEKISIGNLNVTPFDKHHDAQDPVSFVVEHKGIKAGVITDIGIACKTVIHYFKQCHACFLESNYDEQLLHEGPYPQRLKDRISGGKGHISNAQALELFIKHKPKYMSHLLLSHLSKNNNHPDIVQQLFDQHAGEVKIIVASRDEETPVYEIAHQTISETIPLAVKKETMQLNLF